MSVGAATVGGLGVASAATSTTGQQSLVDKIASKFNLNKTDVQKVFDENHAARDAAREQKMKDRLDLAVKDGKLTQDQETKLIAKLKEVQADRKEFKSDTQAARDARKAKMGEFKQWLKDNNIPDEYGMPMGGPGHHGGNEPTQSTN